MKKADKLFEYFAGEHVSVLLNKTAFQSIQQGNNIKNVQSQTISEGYLVDEDDKYFYLGSEPTHIGCAIHKTYIIQMEVTDPNDTDEVSILNSLIGGPESENEVN